MTLRENEIAARRRIARKQKKPSQAEAERRQRQRQQSAGTGHNQGPPLTPVTPAVHRDRVLTFAQWCELNGFSKATGRRIIKSGNGPPVLQLSARRIGVKESANLAWQAACVR